MARSFNGDNNYGQASNVDLSGVNKFTLSFWLSWNTFTNDNDIAFELSANFNATSGFIVNPNSSTSNQFEFALNGNVGIVRANVDRPTNGVFHHFAAHFDKSLSSNEIPLIYIDAVSKSITYTGGSNNNTDNFVNSTLNFMARNGTTLFGAGLLCEIAIWPGVLLDAAEVAALAKGVQARLIRTASLEYYWPFYGRPDDAGAAGTDTEVELMNGATCSLFGDATHEPAPAAPGPALISAASPAIAPKAATTTTQTIGGTLTTAGSLSRGITHRRFYFDSSASAAAAPSFDGSWSSTTGAVRRRLNHIKQSSAIAAGTIKSWANAANTKALDRQYISSPLSGAQAISGTVKMQLQVREENDADNVSRLFLAIKVVSIDGGTVRGTLLAHGNYGPTAEFTSNGQIEEETAIYTPFFRNKTGADGDALTLVNALDGDRILVEIGYSNSTGGSTPEARALWGDTGTDLGENETTEAPEASGQPGWIEFSTGLIFREPSTQSIGGGATPAGNVLKLVGKIL